MANVDKAYGLRPLGNLSGTGAQKQYGYQIADNQSGVIYQGDLVTLVSGYVVKFEPATHSAALGVFNGCFYQDPTTQKPTWKNYYPGSINITQGTITADVIDDPNQLFTIQADGNTVIADVGSNADVVGTGGSTVTGQSTMELDSSDISTAAAHNLKVVGLYNIPGNAFGTNAQVVVKINEHLYGSPGVANT
tara:strand:+ start:5891 stop:6466 length:576 start_codon:yes stop_codon:yes gene_type:complete